MVLQIIYKKKSMQYKNTVERTSYVEAAISLLNTLAPKSPVFRILCGIFSIPIDLESHLTAHIGNVVW